MLCVLSDNRTVATALGFDRFGSDVWPSTHPWGIPIWGQL